MLKCIDITIKNAANNFHITGLAWIYIHIQVATFQLLEQGSGKIAFLTLVRPVYS
jgi:hypothetical protein